MLTVKLWRPGTSLVARFLWLRRDDRSDVRLNQRSYASTHHVEKLARQSKATCCETEGKTLLISLLTGRSICPVSPPKEAEL